MVFWQAISDVGEQLAILFFKSFFIFLLNIQKEKKIRLPAYQISVSLQSLCDKHGFLPN